MRDFLESCFIGLITIAIVATVAVWGSLWMANVVQDNQCRRARQGLETIEGDHSYNARELLEDGTRRYDYSNQVSKEQLDQIRGSVIKECP